MPVNRPFNMMWLKGFSTKKKFRFLWSLNLDLKRKWKSRGASQYIILVVEMALRNSAILPTLEF